MGAEQSNLMRALDTILDTYDVPVGNQGKFKQEVLEQYKLFLEEMRASGASLPQVIENIPDVPLYEQSN